MIMDCLFRCGLQSHLQVKDMANSASPSPPNSRACRLSTKSQRWESNPQPPHYECGALPIEATLASVSNWSFHLHLRVGAKEFAYQFTRFFAACPACRGILRGEFVGIRTGEPISLTWRRHNRNRTDAVNLRLQGLLWPCPDQPQHLR